jgi:hypothetical protein
MDELELVRVFRRECGEPSPAARAATREGLLAVRGSESASKARRERREGGDGARRAVTDGLVWLSGADRALLDRFPHERARYSSLGALVLAVAIISAAGVALLAEFSGVPQVVAMVIALVYGGVSLSLDRWLCATIGGRRRDARAIVSAIPRILLGALLALLIAEPVALRIFDAEVTTRAAADSMRASAEFERARRSDYERLEHIYDRLNARQARLELRLRNGSSDRTANRRDADGRRSDQRRLAMVRRQLSRVRVQLLRVEGEIVMSAVTRPRERLALLSRLRALQELARENTTVLVTQWALRLFLLLLFALPVASRIAMAMGKPSAYERLADHLDERSLRAWITSTERLRDEITIAHQAAADQWLRRWRQEFLAQHEGTMDGDDGMAVATDVAARSTPPSRERAD